MQYYGTMLDNTSILWFLVQVQICVDWKQVPLTQAKNVLGRVRNCVGEQALHCEMVASSYCASLTIAIYAESMFRSHSDHTCGCVVAGVLHNV